MAKSSSGASRRKLPVENIELILEAPQYADQFQVGNRVRDVTPNPTHMKDKGDGQVVKILDQFIYIRWDNSPAWCSYGKYFVNVDKWLVKVEYEVGDRVKNLESNTEGVVSHISDRCINIRTDDAIESHNLEIGKPKLEKILENSDRHLTIGDRVTPRIELTSYGRWGQVGTITEEKFDKRKKCTRQTITWDDGKVDKYHYQGANTLREFLEEPNKTNSLPEKKGYFEHYSVRGKNDRDYFYTRYVYADISGRLKHHHVSSRLKESIETAWRSGATAEELCNSLGKKYMGKP